MKKNLKFIYSEGEETADFANSLKTMYGKWATRNGHIFKETEDGISIEGEDIQNLDQEHGIHRRCRISPFDDAGRRHTTFCRVIVDDLPDVGSGSDIIRAYIFNPVRYVKNLKSGVVISNPEIILNGYVDALWD